ncbi:MAG TPA: hypothetical protein VMY98_07310 [Anaerolineae bacterium]|nr:hypothetical protein [Anaerolineae bacterium]
MAKVIEYEGKLAIEVTGWWPNRDRPVLERLLEVSNVPFRDYDFLEGRDIEFMSNQGICFYDGRPYRFDCDDRRTWHMLQEEHPSKRPRRGKKNGQHYDWKWVRGKWEREWLD